MTTRVYGINTEKLEKSEKVPFFSLKVNRTCTQWKPVQKTSSISNCEHVLNYFFWILLNYNVIESDW